jgi:cytidine deaminase
VNAISNKALIESAQAVLNPHTVGGYGAASRRIGQVGSTLVTEASNLYSGVCIDTGSGTGFCAEHAAIAAMVTARDHKITKIVAVWRDDEGALYALPPCGRCREFIRQIDPANLDTEVVLSRTSSARLRDLLPRNEWPSPLD